MKKIISILLAAIMLASAFSMHISAAGNDRKGITLDRTETNGVSHPVGYYVTEKRFEKMPVTFEAWVYIPRSVYSQRGGIIIGNYQRFSKDDFINFEIHTNGVPRLLIDDPSGTMHDYKFTKAAVRADTWTHVSIVYGTGEGGKQIYCYINGAFKQASSVSNWYEANPEAIDNVVCLAGDYRAVNEQGFRGILGDVAVYSDIRTDDEILADYKGTPDLSDENLMMYYKLSEAESKSDVPDARDNGYDMKYYRMWLTEEEMNEIRKEDEHEYSYVLAFLPDIQYMTEKYPKNLTAVFDFLVNESKTRNIRYAIGLGDITNSNGVKEWTTVVRQTNRLNGYLDYSLVCGNHDTLKNNKIEYFDQYYAPKTGYYYQHVASTGGFFNEDSVRNTYLTFSVGKINYIIINLDFGATDDILSWAGEVLDSHPDHRGILVTHGYLNADGTTLDTNDYASPDTYESQLNSGEDMWQKLVSKHENIDMIVSGHMHHDTAVVSPREGDAGNTVYQVLMDPQSTCNKLGGIGVVGLMYFTEDGNHAKIEYYSTVLDKYLSESNKTLSLTFGEPEEETTAEETTLAPVTDAPTEPVTDAPAEEKGCGGAIAVTAAVIVILGVPLCFKRKED
ncbi:MAG: metallophosphoesterase [Clostridia bacterium]|nr:metallophosphoesterase [Clostridia bacterium]